MPRIVEFIITMPEDKSKLDDVDPVFDALETLRKKGVIVDYNMSDSDVKPSYGTSSGNPWTDRG